MIATRSTDTQGTEFPVCPLCGHVDRDVFELGLVAGDLVKVECEGCLRDYMVELGPAPGTYNTSPWSPDR